MDIRTILGEWLSSHGYKGLRQPNGSCNCLVEGHLMCRSEDVCLIDDDRACVADRAKACDGNDGCPRCVAAYESGIRKCTKLVELEKRLACDEKEIIVNRLAYDRHIQQHNGETVT